jgi:ADP-ribose pyrophosphatase YjhB (NUDIX family)
MDYKAILVVSAVIVDEKNRMLMVREAQPEFYGLWNQPAGHVEPGESIESAFIREVKEESGYDAKMGELWSVHYYVDSALLRMNFQGTLLPGVPSPLAADVLEAAWFGREELESLMREGKLRSGRTELVIRQWIEGLPPGRVETVLAGAGQS